MISSEPKELRLFYIWGWDNADKTHCQPSDREKHHERPFITQQSFRAWHKHTSVFLYEMSLPLQTALHSHSSLLYMSHTAVKN